MQTILRICLAFMLAVTAAGAQTPGTAAPAGKQAAAQAAKPAAAPAGNATRGREIYTSHGCWQCHGRQAQGGAAGPRLGPNPMPLAALVAYVRKPTNQMPPFRSTIISDAELADVHAFLRSLPQPPPLESIELLK